ncbi:MAG TPA: 50S ribosomal protein L25, partial [candidate division Zixibacteria bacterium]|nr:50S ribosomal protein L25 [candidate division Zixibacteria bacterium]
MKEVPIAARPRDRFGKGPARRTRMAGEIPAVVYGPEVESRTIALGEREFHAALRAGSGTTIFNLAVEGVTNRVILREVQRDPVSSRI